MPLPRRSNNDPAFLPTPQEIADECRKIRKHGLADKRGNIVKNYPGKFANERKDEEKMRKTKGAEEQIEVPPYPQLVCARLKRERVARWYRLVGKTSHRGPLFSLLDGMSWVEAAKLVVVENYRNDEEAVKLITENK